MDLGSLLAGQKNLTTYYSLIQVRGHHVVLGAAGIPGHVQMEQWADYCATDRNIRKSY